MFNHIPLFGKSLYFFSVAVLIMARILAAVPLAGLFVLFDLVIDNPSHPDTTSNLALLDIAAGHFSRIEYASRGKLPASILSEFAHIARCYVRDKTHLQGEHSVIGEAGLPLLAPSFSPSDSTKVSQFAPDVETVSDAQTDSGPATWPLQPDADLLAGTDILDLFGSYLPEWNDEWIFGTTASGTLS